VPHRPGTYCVPGNWFVFDLGTLTGAGAATMGLAAVSTVAGTLTNVATVTRNETEFYLRNNTALATTVVLPTVSVNDIAVREGNAGTNEAFFTVTLSAAFDKPVSLYYSPFSGSARARIDFVPASGTVVFPPGLTSTNVPIGIIGDTLHEADEFFFVNLGVYDNVVPTDSRGQCTILNDDGLPGDLYSLEWSSIAATQFFNVPFAVSLTARDASNNVATNFTGSVALTGRMGVGTNTVGAGTTTNSFPMDTTFQDERTQVIYLAGELGGAVRINALALEVTQAPDLPMNNCTIRMKHVPFNSYTNNLWEGTGWTIVYQTNTSVASTGWVTFVFSVPFEYNGVDNVMVDFSFNNSIASYAGYCRTTARTGIRTLYYRSNSSFGDPLTWTGNTPVPLTSSNTPNLRLVTGQEIPIQPTVAGPFVQGVWTGQVAVQGIGANATLLADDLDGHARVSAPFAVSYEDDVGISMLASPDAIAVGSNLTYTLLVTNTGPATLTGAVVIDFLSPNVEFV
jgi:uncharacterized repeat protein (TIGR01451 family)